MGWRFECYRRDAHAGDEGGRSRRDLRDRECEKCGGDGDGGIRGCKGSEKTEGQAEGRKSASESGIPGRDEEGGDVQGVSADQDREIVGGAVDHGTV